MKRKNLLSLFLCLVMLLSLFPVSAFAEETEALPEEDPALSSAPSEELTPADPDEKPVLPQEEVEVEEGVFHGYPKSGDVPEGVYDTDFPELVEFQLVEAGTSLAAGDTVHIRAKFTDNDGVTRVSGYFGSSYSDYWSNSRYLNLSRSEGTDWFEGSYTFQEDDDPGDYFVPYLQAYDSYGFYTTYRGNSKRVMQRLLPGIVTLTGENQGPAVEGPPDFAFVENGQTLSPGDVLHFSFTVQTGLQYCSVYLYLDGAKWFSIGSEYSEYDAETGAVTCTFPLTEDLVNGEYYVNEIDCYGWADNDNYERSWQFSSRNRTYRFTLTGATEPGSEEASVTISDVSCDKDGKTLVDGDTAVVRFRVDSNDAVRYANVNLQYCQAEDWNNTGYYTGAGNRYTEAVLNEETGLYEASFSFGENDVYGAYSVSYISAGTERSSAYLQDTGIMFLFAESASASFQRLSPATNLNWTSNGYARFTVPDDFSGILNVQYYNASNESVDGVGYRLSGGDNAWTKNSGIDQFLDSDLPTGKYYFTVTLRGDGVNAYDSVPAKSPLFSYTAPDAKLGTATDLAWETREEGGYTRRLATFKLPAETANMDHAWVDWYYSETADGVPESCGWRSWANTSDGTGSAYLFDDLLQRYGNGYYYFTVQLVRKNLQVRNGDDSALSPAYNVTGVAESVRTQLQNIETEGKTPEEIREQVAAIPTEELSSAMLSDDSVAELLEELEEAVGAKTVVVSQNVPELADGVRAVGAGLNETITDGNVTLVIDREENEELLPGWCDEALSVTFSMNLENVADAENLTVPVLIDFPIPESFDHDRLVILHYRYSDGEPEVIYPYIYRAGNSYYAQFTLTSFCDFILAQERGPQPQFEPTKYLLLTAGESQKVSLFDPETTYEAFWSVTDENYQPYEDEEDAVISVDDGVVTALKPGTAYVSAYIGHDYGYDNLVYETAYCRVDVIAAEDGETGEEIPAPVAAAVRQVTLLDTKATVELYRTDYAELRILPEMEELVSANANIILPDDGFPPPANNGAAIRSARFTGAGSELFDATVLDDRTIAVVPKESTLRLAQQKASNVKGSYTFGLELTMSDGSVFTAKTAAGADAKVKLTVKKSLPKIKAKVETLNSYYSGEGAPIVFTGGKVTSSWVNSSKPCPSWLYYGGEEFLFYVGEPGAKSGKGTLYLQVIAEGWRVTCDVTVAVSYKNTPPSIAFKSKTLTVKPGTDDYASTTFQVKPARFKYEDAFVTRITEGKGSTLQTYENDTVLQVECSHYWGWGMNGSDYQNYVGVRPGSEEYNDGKAHTYTVYISVAGKEASFTVKTLPATKPVTLKLALDSKAKVMDLAVSKSPVIIKPTTANFNTNSAYYNVVKIVNKADPETDVRDLFDIQSTYYQFQQVRLTAASDELTPGTYIATVAADCGRGTVVEKTISFTVKRSAKVPAPSLKLTATGSIDVLRPYWDYVEIQLKPTNFYDYTCSEEDLTITKIYDGATKQKVSENVTELFSTDSWQDHYYIMLDAGTPVSHADKYTVQVTINGVTSNAVPLKIVQSSPKLTQSTKTVTLLKNDRFSQGEVSIGLPNDYYAIREVKLVTPTDKEKVPYFDLLDLGEGNYAIRYHDNQISVTKPQTVKLQVFLEGNQTNKPNATLTVKVVFN